MTFVAGVGYCPEQGYRADRAFTSMFGLVYGVATGLVEVVVPPAPIRAA
jgi:hypothetical protein